MTPIFLHAGVIHIGSNLFFQCMLGFTFEKRWTALRLGLIYLLTGVAASLLSVAASPKDVSVGASGALFGLVGADCSYLFMNWSQIPQRHQECCFLVFIILINLLFGFTSNATNDGMQANVDNFAHIGRALNPTAFVLEHPWVIVTLSCCDLQGVWFLVLSLDSCYFLSCFQTKKLKYIASRELFYFSPSWEGCQATSGEAILGQEVNKSLISYS